MKVLIIEDDRNKLNRLKSFMHARWPRLEIREEYSYQTGLDHLISNKVDLVLLDMSLPTYPISEAEPGGRTRIYGGKEILRQMQRRQISVPTVVVTQFESFGDETESAMQLGELKQLLTNRFAGIYLGTAYYDATMDKWEEELSELVGTVVKEQGHD